MSVDHNALTEISRVFHFEFWLRYYFAEERNGELFIELNEEQTRQIHNKFSEYRELVESVLDTPLSPELSQRSVVEFLKIYLEGVRYSSSTVHAVLDSKDFSAELYLFDAWIGLHEEQLMQKIYGFDSWMLLYGEWKETEQAKQLAQSLLLRMQGERSGVN